MMTRMKLRVMERVERWDGVGNAEFYPVMPRSVDGETGSAENERFWESSPSGELRLRWRMKTPPVDAGACYYFDLERVADAYDPACTERRWLLQSVSDHGNSITIEMLLHWPERDAVLDPHAPVSGELKLQITNRAVWEQFLGHVGSWWVMTMLPAQDTGG